MDTVLPYEPINLNIEITEILLKKLQEVARELEKMGRHDFDSRRSSSENSRRLIIDPNTGDVFIEVGNSV